MEKKNNLRKKIWLGVMYVLAVFGALTIVVMLISSGENTRNAYKSDFIKPTAVELKESDEQDCEDWLKEFVGTDIIVYSSHAEEWSWANHNTLYVVWEFTASNFLYINSEFVCVKDLEWVLWKKHNGMFGLMIDWNIVAQDTDIEEETEYQFWMDAFM